jgi:hypothetical protein
MHAPQLEGSCPVRLRNLQSVSQHGVSDFTSGFILRFRTKTIHDRWEEKVESIAGCHAEVEEALSKG